MAKANANSITRRRALKTLGATAMLTATVTTTGASQFVPANPDPIFAAIEAHKLAWLENAQTSCDAGKAEEEVDREENPRPERLIHWRNYYIGGGEIDDARERFLKRKVAPAKTIEAEYRAAKAQYEAQQVEYEAWEKRVGIYDIVRRRDRTHEAEVEAAVALTNIVPTTTEGVLALLDYVDRFNRGEFRISDTWYSDADLWPDDLVDDDVQNGRGNGLEMPFAWWIARNVRNAIATITTGEAPSHTPLHA